MKEVRLLELELTNYRNIEHEVYVFDGSNAKIVGENRIGKTNTLEAIYFLLTNYLLDGSSDLSAIKPLSDTKKEVRVEGTFQVKQENGLTHSVRLAKVYGEKWVKTRGSEELSMQGHYEKYFINGIENTRERDYYNNIEELFGARNDLKGEVDKVQMLTNPLYLGNLGEGDTKEWQMLRSFIVKLIGDVSDEEILKKQPNLAIIQQDLLNALGRTDLLKKQYIADIDTLNTQLVGFDSQVSLLEATSNPTDTELEQAKEQIETITNKINEIKYSSGKDSVVEQLEKEIFELTKVIVAQNEKEFKEYMAKPSKAKEHQAKIDELNKQINDKVNEYTNLKIERGGIESQIKSKSAERESLALKYKELTKQIENVGTQIVKECPTCHRPFSDSEIESKKQELLTALESERKQVVANGKVARELVDKLQEKDKDLFVKANGLEMSIAVDRDSLAKLNEEIIDTPTFKESDELVALREKEKELKDQLTARKEKVSEKSSDNYEAITNLESDKMKAQKVIDDRNYYNRQMELLESVKLERKNVSNKLIETEQKREALKTYIYTKLKLLDEHIAKVFGKIKFQLIKENINGGFDPVCKPYIYDIDKDESTNTLWKSGSKSEKIITGIAIVEAIKKELDLTELPYLFDEGGEISNNTLRNKFKTNAQIICVRVEDNILKPIVAKF